VNPLRACVLTLLLCAPAAAETPGEDYKVAFDWSFDIREMFRFRKKQAAPTQAAGGPVFKLVSWNMQTMGARVDPADQRTFSAFFKELFADQSVKVLAAQEIANKKGADAVQGMLSDDRKGWTRSFQDTGDTMDNAFYVKDSVHIDCSRLLFEDSGLSKHPARLAHMRVGDFDFTLITVHLAFKNGRAEAPVAELRHLLDWLREHLAKKGADPDVIVAGDFNLATAAGKLRSERQSASFTAVDEVIEAYPMFRGGNLVALVDEPTSRNKTGAAVNNYDHFIMTGHLFHGAYVKDSARRVSQALLDRLAAIEAENNTLVSDHLPIWAEFRSGGTGGDGQAIRLDGAAACGL
jgi:exonuclease III